MKHTRARQGLYRFPRSGVSASDEMHVQVNVRIHINRWDFPVVFLSLASDNNVMLIRVLLLGVPLTVDSLVKLGIPGSAWETSRDSFPVGVPDPVSSLQPLFNWNQHTRPNLIVIQPVPLEGTEAAPARSAPAAQAAPPPAPQKLLLPQDRWCPQRGQDSPASSGTGQSKRRGTLTYCSLLVRAAGILADFYTLVHVGSVGMRGGGAGAADAWTRTDLSCCL